MENKCAAFVLKNYIALVRCTFIRLVQKLSEKEFFSMMVYCVITTHLRMVSHTTLLHVLCHGFKSALICIALKLPLMLSAWRSEGMFAPLEMRK